MQKSKLEYVSRQLSKGTRKIFETYIINAIYHKVNNPELEIETQKSIKSLDGKRYLMDLYLPQIKMAVEIDEPYHLDKKQTQSDKFRETKITTTCINTSLADKITIKRIPVSSADTIDSLNKKIGVIVGEIKDKISKLNDFKWLYGEDLIEIIKKRGYIETTDDFFTSNVEIVNLVYNLNKKACMQGGYKKLWFPVHSYDKNGKISDRNGWVNYFDETRDIIYEKSNDAEKQEAKERNAYENAKNKIERYVFINEKDNFGKRRKRFAGIFVASGWDDREQAEIWRKTKTRLNIPQTLDK